MDRPPAPNICRAVAVCLTLWRFFGWRFSVGRLALTSQPDASLSNKQSWKSRASKIALAYLADPRKWAAQDKFGKGLTVCQRKVDPGFLLGPTRKEQSELWR